MIICGQKFGSDTSTTSKAESSYLGPTTFSVMKRLRAPNMLGRVSLSTKTGIFADVASNMTSEGRDSSSFIRP